jgi:hypothetical protein
MAQNEPVPGHGELQAAKSILLREPKNEGALRAAAQAAAGLNLLREALGFADRILEINPDDAATWHASAVYADTLGDASAYRRAERACRLELGHHAYDRLRRTTAEKVVPRWHFTMMNDAPRNQAYADSIARHVKDKLVLEIGTGAGLLALLAA